MIINQPYFMENKDWYCFDEKDFRLKLTEKAPQKAVESYREFYQK